jgi:hypothetical protein
MQTPTLIMRSRNGPLHSQAVSAAALLNSKSDARLFHIKHRKSGPTRGEILPAVD